MRPSYCFPNQDGFNVCMESGSIQALGRLLTGQQEYWLTLQDANTNNGDPVYWDQNNGDGCRVSRLSVASPSPRGVGTIPSESFSIVDCPFFEQRPATQAKAKTTSSLTNPNIPRTLQLFPVPAMAVIRSPVYPYDTAGNLYGA